MSDRAPQQQQNIPVQPSSRREMTLKHLKMGKVQHLCICRGHQSAKAVYSAQPALEAWKLGAPLSARLCLAENSTFYGATGSQRGEQRAEGSEQRARTFAAGVVSRVQDLIIRAAALPASRRGEAQAAAPAVVDATRVGTCRQADGTDSWSKRGVTRTGKQTACVACVFRHLAAAERHTCGFQRWVASRFSAA